MTFDQSLSLVLLGTILVLAIWRRVNIGVLALGAALLIVAVTRADVDTMYESFPGDLAVLIIGVALLFAHCERSGAIKVVVDAVFRVVGGREHLLPWGGFVLGAALSTIGAFSTAPIALLVPIMAHMALRYPRSYYLNAMAAIVGANCAGLSPLNPTGQLVHRLADKAQVHYAQWGLWAVSMVTAVVVVLVIQLITALRARRGREVVVIPATHTTGSDAVQEHPVDPRYRLASGTALLAFVVLVVGFKTDVGLTAMAMAALLQLAFNPSETQILRRVPWNGVLLLGGLLTYLGLLEEIGTMKAVQHELTQVSSQALLILVLAYVTALLCNIESSTLGVIGIMMPIGLTAFGHTPEAFGVIAAIAVGGALMVMNPVHVAGTLIVSNSAEKERPRVFNRLLATAATIAILAPGVLAAYPILRS